MTDFNALARENARLAKHQLEEAVRGARQQGQEQIGEMGKGVFRLDSWAGRREIPCEILKETGKDCLLPGGRQASKGGEVYVPKDAVERVAEQSMEARIEERV